MTIVRKLWRRFVCLTVTGCRFGTCAFGPRMREHHCKGVEGCCGCHRYDASMEEPDLDKGGSPLMHAANCGHAAAVTALIEVRPCRCLLQVSRSAADLAHRGGLCP